MASIPLLGAHRSGEGVVFRVWAPLAKTVDVILEDPPVGLHADHPLTCTADGFFVGQLPQVSGDVLYRYRIDRDRLLPDPASRFQPRGVHGPSRVVDLTHFPWSDAGWTGPDRDGLIIYEIHVGTFSPEGTFAGVSKRLPYLHGLGITAIELMPLGDFPGDRNWGYDGVAMFAPARCYGSPEDLQHLIDSAHRLGIAVFLDAVYNHFGPDGNYSTAFSPFFVSPIHSNPWGHSLNFDGPGSAPVREFFIQNALHWIGNYHFDGLRLDATHAIIDDSPRHVLEEFQDRVRHAFPDRRIIFMAEDDRNLASIIRSPAEGGWGFDGVWADDFHHEIRRFLAGDHEGYYSDYRGHLDDLTTTLNRGWLYTGQHSAHGGAPRGTDPTGLAPRRFIFCVQNHDQIGNRALGERLHHQIEPADYRAASTLLLLAPETPLLFMGQEWAASSPFRYFTDHHHELGSKVTEGRRNEFRHFASFSDELLRQRIPDPQARETFEISRLHWTELEQDPHRGVLELYRSLLRLRLNLREFKCRAATCDDDSLLLHWHTGDQKTRYLLLVRLRNAGTSRFPADTAMIPRWHTEETRFVADSRPPEIQSRTGNEIVVRFHRAGAILFETTANDIA